MNLLEKIQKSNTTLIGYDAQNEISVEKLLRFLPSVTLFENVESIEILEHFNSLAHFRDYKLDSLLNDNSVNYIVVDLSSIYFNEIWKQKSKIRRIGNKIVYLQNAIKRLIK